MKVIQQSQATIKVPYSHLGYLAATTKLYGINSTFWFGLFLLFMALLVLNRGICGLAFRQAGTLEKWKAKAGFHILVGVAVILFAGLLISSAVRVKGQTYLYPESVNSHAFRSLSQLLEEEPGGPRRLAADYESRLGGLAELQDGWMNYFRVQHIKEGERVEITLRSGGPDRTFGTGDDLRYTLSGPDSQGSYKIAAFPKQDK